LNGTKTKIRTNRRKYGVSFEEAMSVFYDAGALLIPDPDHSDDEDRFIETFAKRL